MSRFFAKTIMIAAAGFGAALAAGCASTPPSSSAGVVIEAEPNSGAVVAGPNGAFNVPRFDKVPVGKAGFEAYVPRGFPAFTASQSEDGALVETAEFGHDGITFALIGVKFSEAMDFDVDNEEVLVGYLDHLKTAFDVKEAVGYGRGHRLESAPDAKGVIDYWETTEGEQIAVKGWITRHQIAVYTIWTKSELPPRGVMTMFFDGARFPAPERTQ